MQQQTLASTVRATGVGVHSGRHTQLILHPAPPNTGIVFRRVDCTPVVEIHALVAAVGDTAMATCLGGADGVRVATVEHLLSALMGVGLDNVIIDIDAEEVPIMDGSAAPFVFLLQSAGLEAQSAPKRWFCIKKPISVAVGDKTATFKPYPGFRITFTIDFDHPLFTADNQTATLEFSSTAYIREICRARTFGFLHEFEALRAMGLAQGGSLANALVLDDSSVLNDTGLRCPDEFVKHKILDVVGDVSLLGYPVLGEFAGYKSGHALNNKLFRAILADDSAWGLVEMDAEGRTIDVPAQQLTRSAV